MILNFPTKFFKLHNNTSKNDSKRFWVSKISKIGLFIYQNLYIYIELNFTFVWFIIKFGSVGFWTPPKTQQNPILKVCFSRIKLKEIRGREKK